MVTTMCVNSQWGNRITTNAIVIDKFNMTIGWNVWSQIMVLFDNWNQNVPYGK